MRISKREAEYIRPAILYSWEIHISPWRKQALWDDDPILPVTVGVIAERLINKGVLQRVAWGYGKESIRLTPLGKTFSCPKCCKGQTFIGSPDPEKTIDCTECMRGVRLENDS